MQATGTGLRKRPFLLYLLIFLSIEKFVQHMVVTYAFAVDLRGIRSQVVLDYRVLMVSGFLVGILFLTNTFFLWQGKPFSFVFLFCLALFDFLGEFVAQGTLIIDITVSFVVATTILLILLFNWKALRHMSGNEIPGAENG